MPYQIVHSSDINGLCEVSGCPKLATLFIAFTHPIKMCKSHARQIAEQLMKVTSTESTNEQQGRNEG